MQKKWIYCFPLSNEWLFKLWKLSAIIGLVLNIREWSGLLAIITPIIQATCCWGGGCGDAGDNEVEWNGEHGNRG